VAPRHAGDFSTYPYLAPHALRWGPQGQLNCVCENSGVVLEMNVGGAQPLESRAAIAPSPQTNRGLGYPKPRCQTADTLTRRAPQHDARSGRQRLRDTLQPQPVLQLGSICSAYFHPASLYAHAEQTTKSYIYFRDVTLAQLEAFISLGSNVGKDLTIERHAASE
jgi:hypothetical protein